MTDLGELFRGICDSTQYNWYRLTDEEHILKLRIQGDSTDWETHVTEYFVKAHTDLSEAGVLPLVCVREWNVNDKQYVGPPVLVSPVPTAVCAVMRR